MRTPDRSTLNVSQLVVGLVYLGVAACWALVTAGVVELPQIRWLMPATLVVAGAVGLAAYAARGVRQDEEEPEVPVLDDEPDAGYLTGYHAGYLAGYDESAGPATGVDRLTEETRPVSVQHPPAGASEELPDEGAQHPTEDQAGDQTGNQTGNQAGNPTGSQTNSNERGETR